MFLSELLKKFQSVIKEAANQQPLNFYLDVEPVPASRPRVTKWGSTYYQATYEKWRQLAKPLAEAFDGLPSDKPLIVTIDIVGTKPKTGKLYAPRGDVDNFAKAPLDVMTSAKKFWGDDKQIVGLAVFKRYAKNNEKPGTYVSWVEWEEGNI